MKVLLTGATGFVGRPLCERLQSRGYLVRTAVRKPSDVRGAAEETVVGEIGSTTDWAAALSGVDAVVHVAARAPVLRDSPSNDRAYEETNAAGTRRLAVAAGRAGVRRFVYLSTVKVNGEETTDRPYSATDLPQPVGAYATSKWHAERLLLEVASASDMTVAIVRSPLVYGPGVRANFFRLMSWVRRGLPLPFGSLQNVRSLVNIWNLCDLLVHLLGVAALPTPTWMVSDGEDLSTPELICRIGLAMNRRVRLLPVPVGALTQCARFLGRGEELRRLCGSLAIDSEPTCRLLGWLPPVTVGDAIARTTSWYLSQAHGNER